jgi:protein-tyrosine phosphatase
MLDIHTHIIPSVDDGSSSLEMSLSMIDLEIKGGVDEIVFTPHSYCHKDILKEDILKSFTILDNKLREKYPNLKYYLGQEIYYDKTTFTKLENKEYISINNSKYILIEFNYYITLEELEDIIYTIRLKGYEPIIAHIERYNIDLKDYYTLKKNTNVLMQVNTKFVLENKHKAKRMIKDKIIDYIASDCHSTNNRCPNLDKVKKLVEKYNLNINRFE